MPAASALLEVDHGNPVRIDGIRMLGRGHGPGGIRNALTMIHRRAKKISRVRACVKAEFFSSSIDGSIRHICGDVELPQFAQPHQRRRGSACEGICDVMETNSVRPRGRSSHP